MQCVLVSNLDACRLDAELSDSDGNIVAILFENGSGWHLERLASARTYLPSEFVEDVKANMQRYVNRTGSQAPEDLTRGELALWLLLKADGTALGQPYALEGFSNPADFYVGNGCCLSCGVPQLVAPNLIGWVEETMHCYWKKQPNTPEELDQALKVLDQQEVGCHRYAGSDPNLLARIAPEHCGHPAYSRTFTRPLGGYEPTILPENDSGLLRRLLSRLRGSAPLNE